MLTSWVYIFDFVEVCNVRFDIFDVVASVMWGHVLMISIYVLMLLLDGYGIVWRINFT